MCTYNIFLFSKEVKKFCITVKFTIFLFLWRTSIYIGNDIFNCISIYTWNFNKQISKILISLGLLGLFKYSNFIILNINSLLNTDIMLLTLALPIGISFYTFQILSYVIDVYNGKVEVQKSFINLATYVALFPQLIAGPIVRYIDIEKELKSKI